MEQNDLSLFVFQDCGISKVALQLMELCKETMDLAVDPSTASHALLPPTLYRASRELLDLFRACIPALHGNDIATIPRTAAIFHNDCTYFAHKMLSFGLIYRDRFQTVGPDGKESSLKDICTFLDLVPLFRELAERTMNDMIQFQTFQISEIVSPRLTYLCEALGSNEGVVEWSDAETAVTAALYHLRHLSQAWKSMLSHDLYVVTIGSIVDALFGLFLEKVLTSNVISVPACHFVSGLFQNMLRGVSELFGSSPTDPTPTSTSAPGEGSVEAAQFCTLHHKFSAVGKFMDMSLADINMGLSEGVFRSVTGAELSKLVCAIFEDTEARKRLLRLLESN
jgi:centromere/kinetochore protein ZW10